MCIDANCTSDSLLLKRIYSYHALIDTVGVQLPEAYRYTKYSMSVNKRNFMLRTVPTLHSLAHGNNRQFVSEMLEKITYQGMTIDKTDRIASTTSLPRRRSIMDIVWHFLTPQIYSTSVVNDYILSPFHADNARYYKFRQSETVDSSLVKLSFKPRLTNTQLVLGYAMVDKKTGRITETSFEGEYDMLKFRLSMEMGKDGVYTLIPEACRLEARFTYVGNDLRATYTVYNNLPPIELDSIDEVNDAEVIEQNRPLRLTSYEQLLYNKKVEAERQKEADTTDIKPETVKKHPIKWDKIGDNFISRIRQNIGPNNEGYIKIGPILNPLYMGYNHHKGFYYKMKARGGYSFSPNSSADMNVRVGYSFKQNQVYYRIPLNYNYDIKNGGYIKFEYGNGNHITNSELAHKIRHEYEDSVDIEDLDLQYFKDKYFNFAVGRNITSFIHLELGFVYHDRTAVNKEYYRVAGLPTTYRSAAPSVELSISPPGHKSPILTVDYEHSFKNLLNSNTDYERWEFDIQHIYRLPRLQSLSMRGGLGLYTNRDKDSYFLDYTNFRVTNIPEGWDDEWSGEFELLNSVWYNTSKYYIRANLTYESPILLLAWLPKVGHFIEKERVYTSLLGVTRIHPYMEFGYGIQTRWLSLGAFCGNMNGNFNGFGVKFGFELFRDW